MTPLRTLAELGQSVWYDYIRRDLYQGPELRRLIENDDLRGMTSNPTIFAKAIVETDLYDEAIGRLVVNAASAEEILDTSVNRALDAVASDTRRPERVRQTAGALKGKVAIANAQIAYEAFEGVFNSARFAKLKERGAHLQRPLWASTSTKDPAYPDLYYVEALIGPDTVDTMPPETFAAFRDHGRPKVRIHHQLAEAHSVFERLELFEIDFDRISLDLEAEGARKFVASYDAALQTVWQKRGLNDSHQAHVRRSRAR